jgi:chromosomal replication initiator protein
MLARKIGETRFELWFSPQRPLEFEQNHLKVFADSNFTVNRLRNTFGSEIRGIVDHVCGPHVGIEFIVEAPQEKKSSKKTVHNGVGQQPGLFDSVATSAPSVSQQTSSTPSGSRERASSNPPKAAKLDLKSFWFGTNNQFAKAGVEQIMQLPGQFSPLLIHGPSGSGKSHLLEAATNEYRRRLRAKRCVFLTAEQFTNQFVASLRDNRGLPMFRRKYRDLDLLAIDDIQFLAGKNATLNEFQFTLDHLIRQGKQVIVSADRPPMELDTLGCDLLNRLASGLMCPLMFPNLEGRKSIIGSMCRQRNFEINDDVISLIAEQMTRDVRRLSGAINRLRAVSISTGVKRITVEFAAEVLQDLISLSSIGASMVTIEEAVCDITGLKSADLRSNSRRKSISSARMLAMYLSREHTNAALSEIGDYFGGRSHSTVIAARKKVTSLIEKDSEIALANSNVKVKVAIDRIQSKLRIG